MSDSGVRSSWLTLATNSSRGGSSCLGRGRCEIVEDKEGPVSASILARHGGGVDLQPAFGEAADVQFVVEHLARCGDAFKQAGEFVQSQNFEHGPAADVGGDVEKFRERAVHGTFRRQ